MLSVEVSSVAGAPIFGPTMLELGESIFEVKERIMSQSRGLGSWLQLFYEDKLLEDHVILSRLCNTQDIQLLAVFTEISEEERTTYVTGLQSCVRQCLKPEHGCESRPLHWTQQQYQHRYGCKACRHNRELSVRMSAYDVWSTLPEDARHDLSLASLAAHIDDSVYQLLFEDQKADRKIAVDVLKRNGLALRYAPSCVRCDKALVKIAVSQNGFALQYAPEDLRTDNMIVTSAIRQNKEAIQFAHGDLQPDNAMLSLLLKPATPTPRHGQSSALGPFTVLRKSAAILRLVPAAWKARKAFMRAAVRINGMALEHASVPLTQDSGIAIDAVRNAPYAIYFVDQEIVTDTRLLKWCSEILDVRTVQTRGVCALREANPMSLL